MFRILVINPGSTSTKIAVYEDEAPLFVESRDHDTAKLSPEVMEQFELRHRLLRRVGAAGKGATRRKAARHVLAQQSAAHRLLKMLLGVKLTGIQACI